MSRGLDHAGMRHRYEGRSGLIVLLHRLGMEHRKPKLAAAKARLRCLAAVPFHRGGDEPASITPAGLPRVINRATHLRLIPVPLAASPA